MSDEQERQRKAELARLGQAFSNLAPRGVREIGEMVGEFLRNAVADAGTCVDTGFGFGEYDCFVTVGGVEHAVVIKQVRKPRPGER
jgi:hypothetical protein